MKKTILVLFGLLGIGMVNPHAGITNAPEGSPAASVTFSNQVIRIFQNNCQVCHHPGDIGPISLMTYRDAAPWAYKIKEATESGFMPPWKPLEGCGAFEATRRMSQSDIKTLAQWADAGAPEGDLADLPQALEFPEGWSLGEPDLVLTPELDYMPDPTGRDVYRCFTLPTNLTADRYVSAVDIRPGNRAIVHHVLLFVDTTGESVNLDAGDQGPGYTCFGGPGVKIAGGLGGWVPGARASFLPAGIGMELPARSRIVMQIHYHPTGKPAQDRTRIGVYFSKGPVNRIVRTFPLVNASFMIPAGHPHYRVTQSFTIPRGLDVHAVGIAPHMHLLGRSMEVTATFSGGKRECLIKIDDWDFDWQGSYRYLNSIAMPAGTLLQLTAYYDNSEDNPNNPNSPPKAVRWGENTTDEMCIAFIDFTLDAENLTAPGGHARSNRRAADFLQSIEMARDACGAIMAPVRSR